MRFEILLDSILSDRPKYIWVGLCLPRRGKRLDINYVDRKIYTKMLFICQKCKVLGTICTTWCATSLILWKFEYSTIFLLNITKQCNACKKTMTVAYWHSLLECNLHFRSRSRVNHMLLFIHYLAHKYAIVFFYLCVCMKCKKIMLFNVISHKRNIYIQSK